MVDDVNHVLLNKNSCVGLKLTDWLSGGGGQGLEAACIAPSKIIEIVKSAGLLGLGGSGFPVYRKWEVAAANKSDVKYLICNGNEDEPNTFKDRLLMEKSPFQLIEGATIAALACGITHIIFYINPLFDDCLRVLTQAVDIWRGSDLYERSIIGGRPITYEIVPSPGQYVSGEETAILEVLEGRFPFPRGKPPYPVEKGVHGYPTVVNNIETLCNLPHILREGAAWYRSLGRNGAHGTKIYCLSGDVQLPGVYELAMGTSVHELVEKTGGGVIGDKSFYAAFVGGATAQIISRRDVNTPLSYHTVALGTGALYVVGAGSSGVIQKIKEYVEFFAAESCGQCVPCKTGTYYLAQLVNKVYSGKGTSEDIQIISDLCHILPGSGMCHLPNAVAKLVKSGAEALSATILEKN